MVHIYPKFVGLLVVTVSAQKRRDRGLSQPITYTSSDLFGNTECTEPADRFKDDVPQDLVVHNDLFASEPEKWVCEFCQENLFNVVNKVCCGHNVRKRREAEQMDFWFHEKINSSAGGEHTKGGIKLHFEAPECKDDKPAAETSNTEQLSENEKLLQEIVAPSHSRKRRAAWDRSIRKGGKGRSTFTEMLDNIKCPKSFSSDFLGLTHHKLNRAKYRHTFITQECCSDADGSSECTQFEINQTNLNEECCNEGCRYEEILENCGSWRWDEKVDGARQGGTL